MFDKFNNLSLDNVYAMLELIQRNKRYSNAASVYKTYHEHYEVVERFIISTGVVFTDDDKAHVNKELLDENGEIHESEKFSDVMIGLLLAGANEYSSGIKEYIKKFMSENHEYVYRPSLKERLMQSGIRNVLYELGLINIHDGSHTYYLNKYKAIDLLENCKSHIISPELLAKLLQIQSDVGVAAELCVIEYEKNRLVNHPDIHQKIKHISKIDVSAGYDILSWEIVDKLKKNIPRYIEVKTYQFGNKRFYWTRNEVKIAKSYKDRYYLYLVPRKDNKLLIDKLTVINDPYCEIFKGDKWQHEAETYLVSQTSF